MTNRNAWPIRQFQKEQLLISTDPALIDLDITHRYLAEESYWARGESRQTLATAMANSLCYGIYDETGGAPLQIGLARVITDFATYAYLTDVFILASHRGQGIGKWLIASILANPDFQQLRIFSLYTADAHSLYTPFGFEPNPLPQNHLLLRPRRRPNAALSDS
jgi:GNAT superfamily N-acetyltransferase